MAVLTKDEMLALLKRVQADLVDFSTKSDQYLTQLYTVDPKLLGAFSPLAYQLDGAVADAQSLARALGRIYDILE